MALLKKKLRPAIPGGSEGGASQGLSMGVIAGIVVGCVPFMISMVMIGVWLFLQPNQGRKGKGKGILVNKDENGKERGWG